jgi:hypothetical protein
MSTTPDSIWQISTEPRFNRTRRPAPEYLTPQQARRMERIRQARALYQGEHFQFFVGEGRTQFQFPQMLINGEPKTIFVLNNLLKRISHTSADLLFGDEPLLRVDDEIQAAKLKTLADRSTLHATLIETEIECSFAAEAYLEACISYGEVFVVQVPAEDVHPVGQLGPDRQYREYVRYAEHDIGTADAPHVLILRTVYKPGSIERTLFDRRVADDAKLDLAAWPAFDGKPPVPVQPTGLKQNTMVWLPNLMLNRQPLSDYDGLLGLQDTLNAKETQIAVVLAKHANPKLRAPRAAADDNGDLRAASDVLYGDSENDWGYITWDASLDAAFKHREAVIDAMFVASETSPVLAGVSRGAVPESARAMRLQASTSIAKAQRKATLRRPLLRRVLMIAQQLEQTIAGNRYNVGDVSVEPRDGLPVDESELSQTIATLASADAISIERRVELQISDKAASAQEIARIKEMRAAAAPDVLMTEPPAPPADAEEQTPPDASRVAA